MTENTLTADAPLPQWIEQFHRDGYLLAKNVLSADLIEKLKAYRES